MPDRHLHPGQLGAKTPLHPVRVANLFKLARLCCTLSRDFARFKLKCALQSPAAPPSSSPYVFSSFAIFNHFFPIGARLIWARLILIRLLRARIQTQILIFIPIILPFSLSSQNLLFPLIFLINYLSMFATFEGAGGYVAQLLLSLLA